MSPFWTNMQTLEEKAAGKRGGGAWHGEPDDSIGSLLHRAQTSAHHLMKLRHRLGHRWAQAEPDITVMRSTVRYTLYMAFNHYISEN